MAVCFQLVSGQLKNITFGQDIIYGLDGNLMARI